MTVPGPPPGVDADVEINVDLVGRLLDAQHPALADLPRTVVRQGWDNVLVRLGDDLVARLPRRRVAADLARNEATALAAIGGDLPLAVPTPTHRGRADTSLGYPYPWSVVPWLPGRVAAEADIDAPGAATRLGSFLTALHLPAPVGVPDNPFRSGPVRRRADIVAERLETLDDLTDRQVHVLADEVADQTTSWDGPPVWVHGDLHPRNLLVDDDGVLCAVLDFGDVHAGDPAVDLGGAWLLLDTSHHGTLRAAYTADDDTWRRGRAWGIHLAAVLAIQHRDPAFRDIGLGCLHRVLTDLDGG